MVKMLMKSLMSKMLNVPVVIEEGTSGFWNYRKWSDGTAECWGRLNTTTTISGSNPLSAGGYYMLEQAYPITFSGTPQLYVSGNIGSGYCVMARDYLQPTKAQALLYTSLTGSTTVAANIYAIGKWK